MSRLDAKSGSPKTTSATWFSKASANAQAQLSAGQTLFRCSEYLGLLNRMLVDGYVLYHEPDDTTAQVRFKGEPYAPLADGKVKLTPDRVDGFFDLWQVTLPLVSRDVPELIL